MTTMTTSTDTSVSVSDQVTATVADGIDMGSAPATTEVVAEAPTSVSASKATATGKRGRPPVIGADKFRYVWQRAKTLDDVVKALAPLKFKGQDRTIFEGKSPEQQKLYVSMRASALRKQGVTLQSFPRGRKPEKKASTAPVGTGSGPVAE